MDALDAILTRKSTRKFSEEPLDEETLKTILEAGMSAPTAVNCREYDFILVTDREKMKAMAEVNGHSAGALLTAAAAIVVCGDMDRAYKNENGYWVIDCAAAVQNILLAAQCLGVASCWLGTYPQERKWKGQKELFALPESVIPHSIVALGYPEDPEKLLEDRDSRYDEKLVHLEQW